MKLFGQLKLLFPDGLAGIIFDCDGVMIDSLDANRCYYNMILAAMNLPPMTASQESYAFMATAIESLQRMVPAEYHARLADIARTAMDYEKDILPKIKLMPGFPDFIARARAEGLQLGIDTNRTEAGIYRVLDFFGLTNYFDPVIYVPLVLPKPDPEGVRLVCAKWNIQPGQALFLGDSEHDRHAAMDAGAVFAAFGNQGLDCDINVPDYAALARMLWA